ncbi:MAG TPA: 1-deoxy-D-xylulose-5-phosphate reductoisomerase [Alphaproteobacteria bacterium]|nr:1-deoxy-D-xylulose-5-phosphate reductoisomerase [Alphaproteobacteria bacterium]
MEAPPVERKAVRAASPVRRVTVLGSTGSIGVNTLDLVRGERGSYQVAALTARSRWRELADQAREFEPEFVAIEDEAHFADLKSALAGLDVEVGAGAAAMKEAAALDADWVMAAIVGAAGLAPTLEAARRGATVALANKECLVCAGDIFLKEAERHGATLLPVDSEHNAIFQVLDAARPETVEKLILTASGGPFRSASYEAMKAATPEQAVAHPRWRMGRKISVDSATMMNKGLEVIEAAYLFDMEPDRIEVLVHPESVVHSLVAYIDGSVLAQLGTPDMRTPIAYSLAWPTRMPTPSKRLDLPALGKLSFEAPDPLRFPALALARECLQQGGGVPTVMNAANEVAVQAFLERRIGFLDIVAVVRRAVEEMSDNVARMLPSQLEDIWALDEEARRRAGNLIPSISSGAL